MPNLFLILNIKKFKNLKKHDRRRNDKILPSVSKEETKARRESHDLKGGEGGNVFLLDSKVRRKVSGKGACIHAPVKSSPVGGKDRWGGWEGSLARGRPVKKKA